ncbi:MAG TPA: alpha/beta hydrolase [Propionibacteriaceae bacterium]|nr:alpha/beta hydrolase [Propionibacteriaceae bacterium]
MHDWHRDFLPGFESVDLPLPTASPAAGEPADVELVATLVRRSPGNSSRRALLYVHGWNDYFFQSHLAEAVEARGYDFYAVDLRRYGRSLRRGQHFGFITDLDDYSEELDAAAQVIGEDHDELLLMGHSTGGLVTALWAASNPGRITGLVLNSPWLDLQGSALFRTLGGPVISRLGNNLPTSVLRLPDLGFYGRTLHSSLGGEWDYDLELKTSPSPPVRVGWLRAILRGHQRVAAGLQIDVPVLVLCSNSSDFSRRWHEGLRTADIVLDVEQIATRAVRLGRHVTVVRISDGLHDLLLSAPDVRKQVLAEILRWEAAYCEVGGTKVPSGLG